MMLAQMMTVEIDLFAMAHAEWPYNAEFAVEYRQRTPGPFGWGSQSTSYFVTTRCLVTWLTSMREWERGTPGNEFACMVHERDGNRIKRLRAFDHGDVSRIQSIL